MQTSGCREQQCRRHQNKQPWGCGAANKRWQLQTERKNQNKNQQAAYRVARGDSSSYGKVTTRVLKATINQHQSRQEAALQAMSPLAWHATKTSAVEYK